LPFLVEARIEVFVTVDSFLGADYAASMLGDLDDKAVPLAEWVFETLLARIYAGELAPGVVVNEAALAEEFQISRGPVREAIRRLQGIRLVTREPYRRSRVLSLSAETARELFEMRAALEGMACRLAASRMTDADIEALLVALEGERQQALSGEAPLDAFDFHARLVEGCQNTMIHAALCGDLYHLLRIYRRKSGAVPERKEVAFDEHWQIIRALRARDGELAESLMRAHINRACEHLFSQLLQD
jgi:DNA-binding GntR family transcriptional regulator